MNSFGCAIKMEEEARMYYEKLAADVDVAAQTKSDNARKVLLMIAREECSSFVESPKNFLASAEFSTLKEY